MSTHNDVLILNPYLHPDLVLYPDETTIQPGELIAASAHDLRPGAGAYTGRVAGLLGSRVSYIDWVGSDEVGEITLTQLQRLGHDTSRIRRYEGAHMICVSIADRLSNGATMIATYPKPWQRTYDDLLSGYNDIPYSEVIYIYSWFWSFSHPALADATTSVLVRRLREHCDSLLLDPNWKTSGQPSPHELLELKQSLSSLDLLLPNSRDAELLVGKCSDTEKVRRLLDLGAQCVVLTCGGEYVYWSEQDSPIYRIPIPQVDIVDTTGAGDSFGGALAAISGTLEERVAAAAAIASGFVAGDSGLLDSDNDVWLQAAHALLEKKEVVA